MAKQRGRLPFQRKYEDEARNLGLRFIVGCDEAGRGPLAGPVVGAACFIPPEVRIHGLADSKCLTREQRERVLSRIERRKEVKFGVGIVHVSEIDQLNIHHASLRAMQMAVEELGNDVDYALIDGKHVFPASFPTRAVIDGDAKIRLIAAASIIAKVTRDRLMIEMAKEFPGYGFERHVGYATPEHLEALKQLGPTIQHRNFAPVRAIQEKIARGEHGA